MPSWGGNGMPGRSWRSWITDVLVQVQWHWLLRRYRQARGDARICRGAGRCRNRRCGSHGCTLSYQTTTTILLLQQVKSPAQQTDMLGQGPPGPISPFRSALSVYEASLHHAAAEDAHECSKLAQAVGVCNELVPELAG